MKVEKITIHYTEKRSAAYQTAEMGMSIEVSLGEGETAAQAIEKHRPALVQKVTEATYGEIERLAQEGAALDAQYKQPTNQRRY